MMTFWVRLTGPVGIILTGFFGALDTGFLEAAFLAGALAADFLGFAGAWREAGLAFAAFLGLAALRVLEEAAAFLETVAFFLVETFFAAFFLEGAFALTARFCLAVFFTAFRVVFFWRPAGFLAWRDFDDRAELFFAIRYDLTRCLARAVYTPEKFIDLIKMRCF